MLTMLLYLTLQGLPIKIDAAFVRWSSGTTFGVEFLAVRPDEHHRLERYIAQLASSVAV